MNLSVSNDQLLYMRDAFVDAIKTPNFADNFFGQLNTANPNAVRYIAHYLRSNGISMEDLFNGVKNDRNKDFLKHLNEIPCITVSILLKYGFPQLLANGNPFFWESKDKLEDELINALMLGGADLNIHNSDGDTLLTWLINNKRGNIVLKLLKRGIEPNFPDGSGKTPLTVAIDSFHKDKDNNTLSIVRYLSKYGASWNSEIDNSEQLKRVFEVGKLSPPIYITISDLTPADMIEGLGNLIRIDPTLLDDQNFMNQLSGVNLEALNVSLSLERKNAIALSKTMVLDRRYYSDVSLKFNGPQKLCEI